MDNEYPLPNDDYSIGWICALNIEAAAAVAMLDQDHGIIHDLDPADTNSYSAGRVHGHNIVIACLPDGEYGTNAAATVAINMLRTFKNIKVGLLVGIGGGLPDLRRNSPGFDLRLGDVVVSSAKGTSGGVVQYDLGKEKQLSMPNGNHGSPRQFCRTGVLDRPPPSLRTALANLKSRYLLGQSRLPDHLAQVLEQSNLRATFAPPDHEHDRLFLQTYVHTSPSDGSNDCTTCDASKIISRDPRSDVSPRIFYGTILSGNRVIKDATERDRLRDEFGSEDALCVEMEAAGLMNNFPSMVIRGICDYADSHKNDAWHNYAALAAAAFAKDLLSYLSPTMTRNEPEIKIDKILGYVRDQLAYLSSSLDDNMTKQEEIRLRQISEEEEAALKECHQHLSPSGSYAAAKDIIPERVSGTCRWVFEDPKYISWETSSRNDLLWISADPGCGKSVLSKSLIDELSARNKHQSVCYFFFKDSTGQVNLSEALSAIIYQLFIQQKHLRHYARVEYGKHGAQLRHRSNILWRILLDAATSPEADPVWCVIDALDEATERCRTSLIRKLCQFYKDSVRLPSATAKLKLFVTSRPYNDVQRAFEDISSALPKIRLLGENKNDEIGSEIDVVVRHKVQTLAEIWNLSKQARSYLERKLLQMQNRTYLWLDLAIEDISRTYENSYDPNSAAISSLPESVDEAYEKILQSVDKKVQGRVRKILHIVVGARRPLSVGELCIALSILDGVQINRKHMMTNLRHWCGLFIFFNRGRVYLIHQTAKEFLLRQVSNKNTSMESWKSSIEMSAMEEMMLTVCVRILVQGISESFTNLNSSQHWKDFWSTYEEAEHHDDNDGNNDDDAAAADDMKHYALHLFNYASKFWLSHVASLEAPPNAPIWDHVLLLYDDLSSSEALSWVALTWAYNFKALGALRMPSQSPIFLALHQRHFPVLDRRLNTQGFHLESLDSFGRTPLIYNAELGHVEAVKWLLENGADANGRAERQRQVFEDALISALASGPLSLGSGGSTTTISSGAAITELLLAHGADPLSTGCRGYPILLAAGNGNVEAVKSLLHKGVDVNIRGGYYGNALQFAARYDQNDVIELLLQNGANMFERDSAHGNALQAAVSGRSENAVKVLIKHIRQNSRALTTSIADVYVRISHASQCKSVLRMLKHANINVKFVTENNDRVVFMCTKRHLAPLKWILSAEHRTTDDGKCIADWCQDLRSGPEHSKPLLSFHDSQILDQFCANFERVEQSASRDEICQTLVRFLNKTSEPVMIQAYTAEDLEYLSIRLKNLGWQKKFPFRAGGRCLDQLWQHGLVKGVASISRAPSTPDTMLNTLQMACTDGDPEIIEMILKSGADVNDYKSFTQPPLHIACSIGSITSVKLLIASGAGVDVEDIDTGTALYAAAAGGFGEIVELLLDAGADVNKESKRSSRTPLYTSVERNHVHVAKLLLLSGANESPLGLRFLIFAACKQRGVGMVEMLLDTRPVILTHEDGLKHTDIAKHAAEFGRLDIVQLLLRMIVTLPSPEQQIRNLLTHAIQSTDTGLLLLLLEFGADVNSISAGQGAPLYDAARKLNLDIFGMLLAAGAAVNAQIWFDGPGSSARSDRPERGVECYRGTTLQAVTCTGDHEVANILLAAGAEVNIRGDFGDAVQTAQHFGHHALASHLEDYQAKHLSKKRNRIDQEIDAIKDKLFSIKQQYQYLRERQKPGSIEDAVSRVLYKPSTNLDKFDDSDYEMDWADSECDIDDEGEDEEFDHAEQSSEQGEEDP